MFYNGGLSQQGVLGPAPVYHPNPAINALVAYHVAASQNPQGPPQGFPNMLPWGDSPYPAYGSEQDQIRKMQMLQSMGYNPGATPNAPGSVMGAQMGRAYALNQLGAGMGTAAGQYYQQQQPVIQHVNRF